METKRTLISIDVTPALKEHLSNRAKEKGVDLSKYVKAVLKKSSGYKEKSIV